MEKIVRGIFASEKSHKDKLILVETLKPHLLKADAKAINGIVSFCLKELATHEEELVRKLAAFTLQAISVAFHDEVLVSLSVSGDINNTEYNKFCRDMIIASMKSDRKKSLAHARALAAILDEKHEQIDMERGDFNTIIARLPELKPHFEDTQSWMSTWFYYLGKAEEPEGLEHDFELEPEIIASMLNTVGDLLQQGMLSILQGRVLSDIENADIIQISCDNFAASLTQENLSKCYSNLINLQVKGVALSHWILSLTSSLLRDHRYLDVIVVVNRFTEVLLVRAGEEDTAKIITVFLLLHQHSPVLFQRCFHRLQQIPQNPSIPSSVQCTMESLMLRFPHFLKTYGPTRISSGENWVDLHHRLNKSRLSFRSGVGFNNLGNTCYFNSLIQALWLSTPFQQDIVFSRVESVVLSELRRVFLTLSYSVKPSFSPDRLYSVVRPPWFEVGSQQDAAELLRHLFDMVTSGTQAMPPANVMAGEASTSSCLLGGRDFSITSNKYHRTRGIPKEDTLTGTTTSLPSEVITKHFGGRQEITITCRTCGSRSSRSEDFLFLTLPLPVPEDQEGVGGRRSSPLTLHNLLTNILNPELMSGENQYDCDPCGVKADADRTTRLLALPSSFIFTINRFSYDKVRQCRSKLHDTVCIPSEIAFSEVPPSVRDRSAGFVPVSVAANTPASTSETCHVYRLYAVVVHSGSGTESGHYYTYGVPSGPYKSDVLSDCLCFNDSDVTMVTGRDAINKPSSPVEAPYLLFYQRVAMETSAWGSCDIDMTALHSIINDNIKYIQEQQQAKSSRSRRPAQERQEPKRDDGDDREDFDFYEGGSCNDSNFRTGPNHYIY